MTDKSIIAIAREAERKKIVAWLRSIDRWTIDDWGLNATGNIADLLESGEWAPPNESENEG